MRKFFSEHGLTITMFSAFLLFLAGMAVVGHHTYNEQQHDYGRPAIPFALYITSGHFWEATFENWESEFLQMGFFVLLTAYLFQKGSGESKTCRQNGELSILCSLSVAK